MTNLHKRLFALQDQGYRTFHSRLMPGVDPETIIGIRTPVLRNLKKEFISSPEADGFLRELPHQYYEENNLHAMIICDLSDFDRTIESLELFLPYVNNWATCDLLRPKSFGRNRNRLPSILRRWLESDHVYTVRFAMEMLMVHYLDEDFDPVYLDWVASAPREDYYVKMMTAWYFATALAKQYDAAVVYLQQRRLDPWTHNKAIQKAVESYRITAKQKTYLKTLRIKANG